MKENKITDAINYLDYDLIMEADIKAPEKKSATILHLRLALASACAMLACVMLISLPFLKVNAPTGILPVPTLLPTSGNISLETTPTYPPNTSIVTPPDTFTTTVTPPDTTYIPEDKHIVHITLDINPSIGITTENGIVTECKGINKDGEKLLKYLRVDNLEIQVALPIILDSFIQRGYIDQDNTGVILISVYGDETSAELLKIAEDIAAGVLAQNRLNAYIISQKVKYDVNTQSFADAYGISLGKMQYILNLLEKSDSNASESISKLASTSLHALLGLDITNQLYNFIHISDGYNDFGEKILMVRDDKGESIYIEWDKLSKEEQKEIYKYYKPSFLTDIS